MHIASDMHKHVQQCVCVAESEWRDTQLLLQVNESGTSLGTVILLRGVRQVPVQSTQTPARVLNEPGAPYKPRPSTAWNI